MTEVGIDTVYKSLQKGVETCNAFEIDMNTKSWQDRNGVLLTGNEAKILMGFIEASVELMNAAKETIGTKPKLS